MNDLVTSRIAPTPSGFLHYGNAYSFLLTAWLTEQLNGVLRLRIDDLDNSRVRVNYLDDIFDTLQWLGITYKEGPRDTTTQLRQFSQQLRLERYHCTLQQLVATGRVFACTCSRKEIITQSKDGHYPGSCIPKKIPLDTPGAAWRLITEPGTIVEFTDPIAGAYVTDLFKTSRHFIIRRKDVIPAYHIASLTDDLDYGTNLIVRGADLLESTAVQLHLAAILQWSSIKAARFFHHPLLSDHSGNKLSKSAGSTSVLFARKQGATRENFLAGFRQWMEQSGIVRALQDNLKLTWLNE